MVSGNARLTECDVKAATLMPLNRSVGGEILDFILTQIRRFARIVLCGAISAYSTY